MSKGTPSTTTQTTKSEPWGPSQSYLKDIMGQAQGLYNSGAGQSYFPGSTVVPFSPQTEMGLGALENQALQGAPLYDQSLQAAQRSLSGFNPAQMGALGAGYGMDPNSAALRGASQTSNPFYSDINVAGLTPTTAGINSLQQTASGANLNNPLLASQFNQGADLIRNQVGGVFNNSGMFGSAAHQNALTGSLGNLWTNLAAPAYQYERGLQESAANSLAGFQQNDLSRALNAAGMGASTFGQDASRSLQALGQLGNYNLSGLQMGGDFWNTGNTQGLAAGQMLPSLYQYGSMPAQTMLGVGQAREEMGSMYLNDAINRFNFDQNAPWAALDRYSGVVNGLPLSAFGTQSSTGSAQRASNPFLGALGGLSAGAGIAGTLGLGSNPLGWGIMGLSALMGGLS